MAEKKKLSNETDPEEKNPLDDTPQENEIEELSDVVEEWKEEAATRNLTPTASLYKYVHPEHGSAYIYSGYFSGDEIPENKNEIGLKLGSGRYFIVLKRPKGDKPKKDVCIHFRIHPIYDEYKREAEEKRRREAAGAAGNANIIPFSPQQTTQDTFNIVKDILALLLPILKESRQAPPLTAARQDTAQELISSYALMQKVLKTNLYNTADTYKDFMTRLTGAEQNASSIEDESDIENDEPKRGAGTLDKIIKMIEPFFEIIAQRGILGKMAAATVKAAPQFSEILKDKTLCNLIVQYFDRTRGKESADIALKNIGIDRRSFSQQQPGQPPRAITQGRTHKTSPQTGGNRPKAAQGT